MSLSLPIQKDITISERRNYNLSFDICPQSGLSMSQIVAQTSAIALPLFSTTLVHTGYLRSAAGDTFVRNNFFMPSMQLWRTLPETKPDPARPAVQLPILSRAAPVNLPVWTAGRTVSVEISLGISFIRNIVGSIVSTDDANPSNSPKKYAYTVLCGTQQVTDSSGTRTVNRVLARGTIDIVIDLVKQKRMQDEPPPPPGVSVCAFDFK